MTTFAVRIERLFLSILVFVFVSLAIIVTGLRVMLPRLDNYQAEITAWFNQASGIHFTIGEVNGFWRNTHPSLSLKGLKADLPQGIKTFSVGEVRAEFDLLESLVTLSPKVSELTVDGLHIDISDIDLFTPSSNKEAPPSDEGEIIRQLEHLLLHQLSEFAFTDSSLAFTDMTGKKLEVEVERLQWLNTVRRHRAEGVVSIKDAQLNSVSVIADFIDNDGLFNISGDFYLQGDNFDITPWVTPYLADGVVVDKGRVSLNAWLTLDENQPVDAYLDLEPSRLSWRNEKDVQTSLSIDGGVMKLDPLDHGWQVNAQQLALTTNGEQWPNLNLAFQWTPESWKLNANRLQIERLSPIIDLLPGMQPTEDWLEIVKPGGLIENVRVSMADDVDSLRYSAELKNGHMNYWELIPGFSTLEAKVFGRADLAKAEVTLVDDTLPYGEVFQAPLKIRQGKVDIVWQSNENGWSLWSDKVTAATPDLQALGAFKLDFPKDSPAFLSFYLEADLRDAGQTWRYLPTLALGRGLTDYLSAGIQAGQVSTAKLLWYGELSSFPYRNNDGMFQAWVPLRKTKFSFSTEWPPLTDMQLDLLFQNETMFLDSRDAKLRGVHAERISGQIPRMYGDGHIEIFAAAKGEGSDVRDYMNASPLVNSVGAALTTIDIKGKVGSQFELFIPFNTEVASRAWGYADLSNNEIHIDTPAIDLSGASGRIEFDNDKVSSSGLSATLLDQPINLDFSGQNTALGYGTKIDIIGDWQVEPLIPYLGEKWLEPVSGHAPWKTEIDLQLNDVGFTYQIDTKANLNFLASGYPAPLNKKLGEPGQARLQASGNQASISARLQIPEAKFQTEIDISSGKPVLAATNTVIGAGAFRVSPIVGHNASLRLPTFDFDKWVAVLDKPTVGSKPLVSDLNAPDFPIPHRIQIQTDSLKLGDLDWDNVNFLARNVDDSWQLDLNSSQAKGKATYNGEDLKVNLSQLQLYIDDLPNPLDEAVIILAEIKQREDTEPTISDFDRMFFDKIPSIDLTIDDFWMQGYKVGEVDIAMKHDGNRMNWERVNLTSTQSTLRASGWWELGDENSQSHIDLKINGEDNSEIMARFGISSGIQKAPFDMSGSFDWLGSPWNMQVDTLDGNLDIEFGRGVISQVGGAAKLLGIFSLDSIVRRLQLDFTDIFDEGLAFDSITGTGKIEGGVFVTNDIYMDSIPGDLTIKGLANLNTQQVDAEVTFSPDLNSGLPALTAFAVAPQVALYVLAVSTVVAPVVEVFTKVTYEVKGPLNSPVVKEKSRRKNDYEIPKEYRKESQSK